MNAKPPPGAACTFCGKALSRPKDRWHTNEGQLVCVDCYRNTYPHRRV